MKVTSETIEHVADLARLKLSKDEKERFTQDMANIMTFMDKLNELDISDVEPTSHVIPICNIFREDNAGRSYDLEKIIANAPASENGCFKVPKVIE